MNDVNIKNKCFKVLRNKIEGRLDPFYIRNITSIREIKSKYPLVALRELLKNSPQYGANERAIEGNPKTDIRYIRITDIDEFGNLRNLDWKTAEKIEEKYLLKEGDVLFARSGATAGKTFIYRKNMGKAIFAGYLIRFEFDKSKVNPFFVFYYTQLKRYNSWVNSIQRPSGQPNINAEEFKSFKIPLPPLEIQNKIVKIMQSAYEQKSEREGKAEKLLDSVDDYILSELDTKLPEIKDEKYFTINTKEVTTKRLDPYYYQPKFKETKTLWEKSRYKTKPLKEIVEKSANDKIGVDMNKKYVYIEIGDINNVDASINLKAEKIGKKLPKGTKKKLMKNDIIISTVRPYLKGVAKVRSNKTNLISTNAFCVLRAKNNINPDYLLGIVRTDLFKAMICKHMSGTTYPTVSEKDILHLKIPSPLKEIQKKIGKELSNQLSKAKKLKWESQKILEKAKKEVKKIILTR